MLHALAGLCGSSSSILWLISVVCTGDGTGGTSIWGTEFQDEFDRSLRHDRPFTLSMANAVPNTIGSEFFITTVTTHWLDYRLSLYGMVSPPEYSVPCKVSLETILCGSQLSLHGCEHEVFFTR